MGRCIDKIPHSCGTEKGLQVYLDDEDNINGYCWACDTYVEDPYGTDVDINSLPVPKEKSPEEIEDELQEILTYPTVEVKEKRLRKSLLEEFGVRTGLSEYDGKTPKQLCYPYYKGSKLTAFKCKIFGKNKIMWSVGSMKDVDPFGWSKAIESGAKKLIIAEGEDDVMSIKRIYDIHDSKEWEHLRPAVISPPHGAGSAANYLSKRKKDIDKFFQEILLCFDNDKAGQDAVEEVTKLWPDAKIINLPCKDANDCLKKGKAKAAFAAINFRASASQSTRILNYEDIWEKACVAPEYGQLSWPWSHINKATRGIRYGNTYYIGSGVKMGKSDIVNELAAHFIREHGVDVLLGKLEEDPETSVKLLAGKFAGKKFNDPEVEFDKKAFERASKEVGSKCHIIDAYQMVNWKQLKDDIVSSAAQGVKAVFIDPITNLTAGMSASEANDFLAQFGPEIAALTKNLNLSTFIFCHLKSAEGALAKDRREKYYKDEKYIGLGNCSHELGGDVISNQFAGSRAMMRSCHYMLGLEGNKDPDLTKEIRNIRNIKILEDRDFGESGSFPIYYEHSTGLYKEL